MKPITVADVLRVALALIAANGTTSTHEVKMQLRAEHFFAKQDEVSKAMDELYADPANKLERHYVAGHWEYALDLTPAGAGSPSQTLLSLSSQPAQQIAVLDPGNPQDLISSVLNKPA